MSINTEHAPQVKIECWWDITRAFTVGCFALLTFEVD